MTINLNILRYIDTIEVEEEINIQAIIRKIKSLEAKHDELKKQMDIYFKELVHVF